MASRRSFLQKPLAIGADVVIYSTTKYIAGHSDVVGGAVVVNDPGLQDEIKFYQKAAGGVRGPFDAWLTLRGVKTLAVRMPRHSQNANEIARFLRYHAPVEDVHYPGLPDHPQHALAVRQMSEFGGMMTVQLHGGREQANAFVRALRLFSFAESLGGVESLACHMRLVDDIIDNVPDKVRFSAEERAGLETELDRWDSRIRAACDGHPSGDPLGVALSAAVLTFPVPVKVWFNFTDAMRFGTITRPALPARATRRGELIASWYRHA